MIFLTQAKKNILSFAFSILVLHLFSVSHALADNNYTIPDEDVMELNQQLVSVKKNIREEALLKLKWAGISDPRVFDPILERIKSTKRMSPDYLNYYTEILVSSGNQHYLSQLESLAQNGYNARTLKSTIERMSPEIQKYKAISDHMNSYETPYSDRTEFWEKRYSKGLNVDDSVRVQLAARDLSLRGGETKYYNVAAEYLKENYKKKFDDEYMIDALSYLCRSLGYSRKQEYQSILTSVANFTPNKKLARYAEDSARYIYPTFKSSNPVLHSKKAR